jgi:hypothetical protein
MMTVKFLPMLLLAGLLTCRICPAQVFDYDASSLIGATQCDPLSCEEDTGVPVTVGYVIVNMTGTCYPAVGNPLYPSFPLAMRASANVPIDPNKPCSPPGVYLLANIEYSTTRIDENTCPASYYEIDYETSNAEIFDSNGIVLGQVTLTWGCDGSNSGPNSYGVVPC